MRTWVQMPFRPIEEAELRLFRMFSYFHIEMLVSSRHEWVMQGHSGIDWTRPLKGNIVETSAVY